MYSPFYPDDLLGEMDWIPSHAEACRRANSGTECGSCVPDCRPCYVDAPLRQRRQSARKSKRSGRGRSRDRKTRTGLIWNNRLELGVGSGVAINRGVNPIQNLSSSLLPQLPGRPPTHPSPFTSSSHRYSWSNQCNDAIRCNDLLSLLWLMIIVRVSRIGAETRAVEGITASACLSDSSHDSRMISHKLWFVSIEVIESTRLILGPFLPSFPLVPPMIFPLPWPKQTKANWIDFWVHSR